MNIPKNVTKNVPNNVPKMFLRMFLRTRKKQEESLTLGPVRWEVLPHLISFFKK